MRRRARRMLCACNEPRVECSTGVRHSACCVWRTRCARDAAALLAPLLAHAGTPPCSRGGRFARGAHAEPRSFFLTRSRGERGGVPGRAAFFVSPSLPRPDPRSCCLWFLPVGSRLIPPGSLPGEGGFTPRTLTRPERTTPSRD